MDEKMYERMLARGVAESMLRAGGKLPARATALSVWAFLVTAAAVVVFIGLIVAFFGATH